MPLPLVVPQSPSPSVCRVLVEDFSEGSSSPEKDSRVSKPGMGRRCGGPGRHGGMELPAVQLNDMEASRLIGAGCIWICEHHLQSARRMWYNRARPPPASPKEKELSADPVATCKADSPLPLATDNPVDTTAPARKRARKDSGTDLIKDDDPTPYTRGGRGGRGGRGTGSRSSKGAPALRGKARIPLQL